MPLPAALSALAAVLWRTFPTPADIAQAVTFAGLPPERIHFTQPSASAWRDVLLVARRRRQLPDLLDHVVAARPGVPELADAAAVVRHALGDDAGGILETGTSPPPERPAPSQLLDARYEVVPWHARGRDDVLFELNVWAGGDRSSVWLLHAEGGVGKTRLAIEWARRLRAAGWYAGFLPKRPPEGWAEDLCICVVPLLVVIDYAESRPDLTKHLEEIQLAYAISYPVGNGPPLRVLLLARNDGDWFATLRTHPELGAWVSARPPRDLGPVAVKPADRAEVFDEAATVFAAVRQRPAVLRAPVAFSDERFERVLYLHMAALAAVDGLPFDAGGLMNMILDHEEHFWEKRALELRSDRDFARHRKLARQLVAAATLRGHLAEKEVPRLTRRLVERELNADDEDLWHLLHRIYERSGEDVWQPGLEPDLLGEAMVVRVASPTVKEQRVAADWIDRVFPEDDADALRVGFTVLGRASATAPEATRPWIERMLAAGELVVRAPVALEAAKVVGKRTAFAALGRALAEALEAHGNAVLVVALERVGVPQHTVSLREVAAWIDRTAHRVLGKHAAALAERAWRANNLGVRFNALGRHEEALTATEEAVSTYRTLTARNPDAFRSSLATSLNNLGAVLNEVGRWEEALAAAEEAVGIRRTLAARDPDAFLPDLTTSLNNLGSDLSDLGRREEALAAAQEAVTIRRMLAARNPDAFLPDLATSLHNLGSNFNALGRWEEAFAAGEEAVAIRRGLAARNPDAFLPDLATSLNNLGDDLCDLGRREEALAATEEALAIHRTLVARNPDAFLPDLALSLNNLGNWLNKLGRPNEALAPAEEAVRRYRTLATRNPHKFLSGLSRSLNNLGTVLNVSGRSEEALAAAEEAVAIRRALAARNPDAFLPDLATSYGALGQVHGAANDFAAAAVSCLTGAELLEPLRQRHPQAFARLADALRGDARGAIETLGSAAPPELTRRLAALPPIG